MRAAHASVMAKENMKKALTIILALVILGGCGQTKPPSEEEAGQEQVFTSPGQAVKDKDEKIIWVDEEETETKKTIFLTGLSDIIFGKDKEVIPF